MPTRLLIVDDHEDFREAARALLSAQGVSVVGVAADGGEALAAVAALKPGAVLLDVQLPDVDGFTLAAQLAALPQAPVVILISSRDAASYGERLRRAPVRGFIAKDALSAEAVASLLDAR